MVGARILSLAVLLGACMPKAEPPSGQYDPSTALGSEAGDERGSTIANGFAKSPNPEPESELFRFEAELDLTGLADGRPLGSIFEAVDAAGQPVISAYFSDGHSLHVRQNHHVLNFVVRASVERAPALERIGKPIADASGSNVVVDGKDLVAFFRPMSRDQPFRLDGSGAWMPDLRFGVSAFGGIQRVGSHTLQFSERGVELDGSPVFVPTDVFYSYYYYYAYGTLVIAHRGADGPGSIAFCSWSIGDAPVDIATCPAVATEPGDYPLTFAAFRGDLLIAMNADRSVRRWSNGKHDIVFQAEEGSWQGYGFVRYRDRLLLGQYPLGQLFEYDGATLRPFAVDLPPPPGASTANREAQVLALHDGELYAGVWPWGEVWRLRGSSWQLVGRAFTGPAISGVDAPFEAESRAHGLVANKWGQRVMGLVSFGSSLYVTTMNKGGEAFDALLEPFIAPIADEYGAISRLSTGQSVAAEIAWPGTERTRLEFVVLRDKIFVRQDGETLAELEGDFSSLAGGVFRSHAGCGVAGPFPGTVNGAVCSEI